MTAPFSITDPSSAATAWHCTASLPPCYEAQHEARFPVVYLPGETDTEPILSAALALGADPFILVGIEGKDWNTPFSPWPEPKLGKNLGPFAGGAPAFHQLLTDRIKPYVDTTFRTLPDQSHTALAGYSLAGLFSLYTFCSGSSVFSRFACMSGSLWFPGWTNYVRSHLPVNVSTACMPELRIYLSLGDREKESRNPVMARVADCTQETLKLLESYHPFFEWNTGGHFNDVATRIAKGIAKSMVRKNTNQKCKM